MEHFFAGPGVFAAVFVSGLMLLDIVGGTVQERGGGEGVDCGMWWLLTHLHVDNLQETTLS